MITSSQQVIPSSVPVQRLDASTTNLNQHAAARSQPEEQKDVKADLSTKLLGHLRKADDTRQQLYIIYEALNHHESQVLQRASPAKHTESKEEENLTWQNKMLKKGVQVFVR